MKSTDIPDKFPIPFANTGTKNSIPEASQIGVNDGYASLTDGFPPLTFQDIAAGGIPPRGSDFNGILYMLSAAARWAEAGGVAVYDSTFATSIGGYPKGALVQSPTQPTGWMSTAVDNSTDVDTDTSGNWVPVVRNAVSGIAVSSIDVTLTPPQYGASVLRISGTLTANVTIYFPAIDGIQWQVINTTSGAFSVTLKCTGGSQTVNAPQGNSLRVYSDGSNLYHITTFASQAQALNLSSGIPIDPFGALQVAGKFGLGSQPSASTGDNVDLNNFINSGFYRLGATITNAPSAPANIDYGQMLVIHGGADTIAQVIFGYQGGAYYRAGNPADVGGTGTWGSWQKLWDTSNFDPSTKADLSYITGNYYTSTYIAANFAKIDLSNVDGTYVANKYGARIGTSDVSVLGSVIFAKIGSGSAATNVNVSGSNLVYSSHNGSGGVVNIGTWRCSGYAPGTDSSTTWIRVA